MNYSLKIIKLPIIVKNKSKSLLYMKLILFISILSNIIGLIFGIMYDRFNNTLTQICIFIFIIGFFYWIIANMLVKKFKIIGEIILKEKSFLIECDGRKIEYFLNTVDDIKIIYDCYEGEDKSFLTVGSLRVEDGNNNFFEFSFQGTKFKYEFFMKNVSWLYYLTKKIHEWEIKNNVKIKFIKL